MVKNKILSRIRREVPMFYDSSDNAPLLALQHKEIWFDGGFPIDSSLDQKADFYYCATLFVMFIKEIIALNQEETIYIGSFKKGVNNFEHWSNLNEHDCFVNLSKHISNSAIKKLKPLENGVIIDYIVENGLRYLTNICLYLPNSKIIVKPECHTKLEIYCAALNNGIDLLSGILKNEEFNGLELYKYDGKFSKINV